MLADGNKAILKNWKSNSWESYQNNSKEVKSFGNKVTLLPADNGKKLEQSQMQPKHMTCNNSSQQHGRTNCSGTFLILKTKILIYKNFDIWRYNLRI